MDTSTSRKADFQPIRVGRRLMVVPAWLDPPLPPGVIPIRIDPGRAFGTGEHPSTRLCLMALERHWVPGSCLDVGTGSGILSIAAVKLGVEFCLALDTDGEAVRAARENVSTNGLAGKVRVEQGSVEAVLAGRFGMSQARLVVVNILANIILALFEAGLSQAVTPGGLLILSGVLRSQTPGIYARLQWDGLDLLAQERMEDWVCIIARRPGGNGGDDALLRSA